MIVRIRAPIMAEIARICEHLPYLKDLGVTTLWLTPILKTSGSDYHGYGAVDSTRSIHILERLGTIKNSSRRRTSKE